MKKLWHRITHIGVDDKVPENYIKYVTLLNIELAIVTLWLICMIFLYAYLIQVVPKLKYAFMLTIAYTITYPATFIFVYFQKFLMSKVYVSAIVLPANVGFCLLLGEEYNQHLFFVLLAINGFLIFSSEEQGVMYSLLGIIIALFFGFLAWFNYHPGALPVAFTPEEKALIPGGTAISTSGLMILMVAFGLYFHKIIRKANDIVEREKDKSENLLLNILPGEVAGQLKEHGMSQPVRYDSVSVLFTDFVGFTKVTEGLEPEDLIGELDKCFSYFDAVTKKYNLEKIKTIGDSYMLAGGLPEVNHTHAIDCSLAALEIQAFMNQMKEIKEHQGFPYWELRLGINTGPLVAGVIGEMKFAYDVFGDTVNTASRMESSGVSGKINISKSTYEQVSKYFDCEHRGKIQAKHKGEIDMYFLNGIKPELSVNGDGQVPNREFKKDYVKARSI